MIRWLLKGWRGDWDLTEAGLFMAGCLALTFTVVVFGLGWAIGKFLS